MKKKTLFVLTTVLLGITSCTTTNSVTPSDITSTSEQTTNLSDGDATTISNEIISETTSDGTSTTDSIETTSDGTSIKESIETTTENTSIEDSTEISSEDESTSEDSPNITSNNPDDNPGTSSVETEEETLISTYKFNGETFQYKNLKVFGTFEENRNGTLDLVDLGEAVEDEFIVVPESIEGVNVTGIRLSASALEGIRSDVKFLIPKTLKSINFSSVILFPKIMFDGGIEEWLEVPGVMSSFSCGPIDLYLVFGDSYTLIRDLVIPDGIEEIPNYAFSYVNIQSLTLPSSLKKIGSCSFRNCIYLKDLILNEGLEELGSMAFSSCTSLETLVLPSTLTKMSNSFMSCTNLLSLEIKTNTQVAVNQMVNSFQNCQRLFKLIDRTGNYTTFKNPNIQITVANENDGLIFESGDYLFGKNNNQFTLLSYKGNDGEVSLPTSIVYKEQTINNYILGAASLSHIATGMIIPIEIGYDIYSSEPTITKLTVPNSVTSILTQAFKHAVFFNDGTSYIKEIYFDFDQETITTMIPNYNKALELPTSIDLYCKEGDKYVLFRQGH